MKRYLTAKDPGPSFPGFDLSGLQKLVKAERVVAHAVSTKLKAAVTRVKNRLDRAAVAGMQGSLFADATADARITPAAWAQAQLEAHGGQYAARLASALFDELARRWAEHQRGGKRRSLLRFKTALNAVYRAAHDGVVKRGHDRPVVVSLTLEDGSDMQLDELADTRTPEAMLLQAESGEHADDGELGSRDYTGALDVLDDAEVADDAAARFLAEHDHATNPLNRRGASTRTRERKRADVRAVAERCDRSAMRFNARTVTAKPTAQQRKAWHADSTLGGFWRMPADLATAQEVMA